MNDPQFWTFLGALAGALATVIGSFFANKSNKNKEELQQDKSISDLDKKLVAITAEVKACREDIARLERKQDKYNNLQERTHKNETEIAVLKKAIEVK